MQEHPVTTAVRKAGVSGQGGAGFPTHVKLAAAAEIVIANGCECEPLLATDTWIMEHKTEALLTGLEAAMHATGAARGIIALKRKHGLLVEKLRTALAKTPFELLLMDNFYPAGDEQVLICEATGRSVPPQSLPRDVGCLVSNVGTLVAVAEALQGLPVTARILTITGAVARPCVFAAPIGTSILECIEHAGGSTLADSVVVMGGPMMGAVLDSPAALESAVVTKTLNGIIVLPSGHHLHKAARQRPEVMRRRAAAACIQCRYCTDLCPRYLIGHPFETHRVMRCFGSGTELDAEAARQALLCCGCGICEHVACPMGLSPASINAWLKRRFAQEGIRYEGDRNIQPDNREWRELRKLPLPRLASRIGISEYMDLRPQPVEGPVPSRVRVPLRQHIGIPAQPVCAQGDHVQEGELIARIPDGSLGVNVHASISGFIEAVDSEISIRRT